MSLWVNCGRDGYKNPSHAQTIRCIIIEITGPRQRFSLDFGASLISALARPQPPNFVDVARLDVA